MTKIVYSENNAPNQIGIFLSKQKWNHLVAKQHDPALAELVRATSALGISPLWFSIPQQLLDMRILIGATERHGIFQIGPYPMPKVVYDLGVFKTKDRAEVKKIRAALAEQHVTFVNSHSAFSKWATHVALSEDRSISPYLPSTVRFSRNSDLADMLFIYPKLCVKSLWGSRGKEVMFIEQSHKGLTLLYPNGSVKTFGQIEDLVGAISSFMEYKPFIIQQWIALATKKKRRFDIRVLLQKVSMNLWDCTALSLRLALPGHGSTNISQGGEVKQVSPVLLELWPSRYLEIIATIKELAFNVAQKLEDKYGPLGELGIDIGIDINGGVWLFEVNSKPGKVTVRKLKQDALIQHAYQRPLLYAEMLLKENSMAMELKLTAQKFWQISPYLAEYLAVEEGEVVWLYVGANRCEVIVKLHDNYPCMSLNKQWAADLHLTPGKWKVRRVRDGIRLGPIIGIVCRKIPSHPPAESSWFHYLSAIDGGLGILLTPERFDRERRCVYGLTLSEDKLHWVEGELPWPDALYVRTYPVHASLKAFLQKEFPFRHFNTQTQFNKCLVFQLLSRSQDIKPHLPETAMLGSDPAILNSVPIRQELIDIMGENQYLMQKALLRPDNDNRTSDIRVLMQKKDDGLWHNTGLWGRTIPKDQRKKEIYRLCLLVAFTLEEHFGQLGEIGLDLCIDCEEHLRILDVNGMPNKKFFTEFYSLNFTKRIYSAPMLYAAYLCGFSDVIYPLADIISD